MANLLGITQATYSRTESGVTHLDEGLLQRIAEILEVPRQGLFLEESSKVLPPPTQQAQTTLDLRDIPAVLRELRKLLDDGVITRDQFDEKRGELLARL